MIEGIYPKSGPRAGAPESEVDVYEALRDTLPAGWVAWHSLGLPKRFGGECEVDFVVAHPELGGVILEAKGGTISIRDGQWRQNSHLMKRSPLDQAFDGMRALLDVAKRDDFWLPRFTPTAAFPHTSCEPPPTMATLEGRIFGREHLDSLGSRIEALVLSEANERPVNSRWVAWLHELWCETWVTSLRPAKRVSEDAAERIKLDERQRMLLELLDLNRRVLVQGVAGTGKSLLALESARRRARLGRRVLLCCFTRALARSLRRQLGETTIEVWTVRELALSILKASGEEASEPEEIAWETVSTLAAKKREHLPDFDSVIIDEAQDLSLADWDLVMALSEGRRLWAFTDEGQGFWRDRPLERAEFGTVARLGIPYRTPGPLFDVAASCLAREVDEESLALAVEERRLTWLECTEKKSAASVVREDVKRLLSDGVDARDIAILSLRGQDHPGALKGLRGGKLEVACADDEGAEEMIVADTFLRFKGLERPIIYVVDVGAVEDKVGVRLYVALTRALTEVRIVASRDGIGAVDELAGLLPPAPAADSARE